MDVRWLRPDNPENISVGRHRIANGLRDRGHTVTIENTTPHSFLSGLRTQPDVLIATTHLPAIVGTWRKLLTRTPLVIDHIDPIDQMHRSHSAITVSMVDYLERACFRLADHVLIVYDEELDRVHRHTQAVTTTKLGVDYDHFANPPEAVLDLARETLHDWLPDDVKVLIYIGGLEPEYNLAAIVDALDSLDGWHLVVLGDGSRRSWLEEQDTTRDDVHYLGTVPYEEIPGYLHAADVGISLLDDPNTLKVLEYGSAGLPVVQVEGSAEPVLGDRVTYCTLDSAAIAEAVTTASTQSGTGLAEFAADHDWPRIVDEYESVLQRVAGNP